MAACSPASIDRAPTKNSVARSQKRLARNPDHLTEQRPQSHPMERAGR